MRGKLYSSLNQAMEDINPTRLMEDLHVGLCGRMHLDKSWNTQLIRNDPSSREGSIELVKTLTQREMPSITSYTRQFYIERGFKVEKRGETLLARKGEEEFRISFFEHSQSYRVLVEKFKTA